MTKVLATKFFARKIVKLYEVKFVNAVPITCNHPKIDIINSRFPVATPRFLIRFLAWTKLAQAKLWVRYCIFNCSNHVYNSTFIVIHVFLSVNIPHCINNIGPCYSTVVPMWPKSDRTIGPKSTFLCHLVQHRTLLKTLNNTFTLAQFSLLCYMFDDLFDWMGKISATGDDNN